MWGLKPNKQYNVAKPGSLPVKIATFQRRRMFSVFMKEIASAKVSSVLDVGVTSDQSYEASNYFEAWYPDKNHITAVGVDDARFLEDEYTGVRFLRANGLHLPFRDDAFDIVHSSAVLEHVGCFTNQQHFIAECARVSRQYVFLTTPNRWFPIEFHTVLPFLHWLPATQFRTVLRLLRMDFFSKEENLNLMDRSSSIRAVSGMAKFEFRVVSVSLLCWPSNLLIIGRRA